MLISFFDYRTSLRHIYNIYLDSLQKKMNDAEKEFRSNLLEKFPDLRETQLELLVILREVRKEWKAARILGISERTVESRCYHIRKKMKLSTKEDLVALLDTF